MNIELEGAVVVCYDRTVHEADDLRPGDTYVAKRNTGWKLLTCAQVVYTSCADVHGDSPCAREHGRHPSYILPVENEYAFDAWEAWKVQEIR